MKEYDLVFPHFINCFVFCFSLPPLRNSRAGLSSLRWRHLASNYHTEVQRKLRLLAPSLLAYILWRLFAFPLLIGLDSRQSRWFTEVEPPTCKMEDGSSDLNRPQVYLFGKLLSIWQSRWCFTRTMLLSLGLQTCANSPNGWWKRSLASA